MLPLCVRSLPGSRTERALNASFYRMLPELLRFSSAHQLISHIPTSVQAVHGAQAAVALPPIAAPNPALPPAADREDSEDSDSEEVDREFAPEEEIGDDILGALGL